MGIIMHENVAYGGGSVVEANPAGTASTDLMKLGIDGVNYNVKDANAAPNEPTFTEASTRANISGSGETMATILGKIKKWFSDLKDLAFKAIDSSNSKKYLRGDGTWQSALELQGRVYESGDDEGLVIKPASNHWAGISLVNNTGRHSYIAMKDNDTNAPFWRYNNGTNQYDVNHPSKSGTIALTSDITDEKVTGQTQNPSSITAYNVPFIGTTNQKPYYNDGLKYSTKEGDASNVGVGQLWLGNGTSSGTAGNKKGSLILYGEKNGYANLKASPNSTTDRDIFFPDASGTVALTSDLTPENIGAVPIRKDYDTYTQLAKLYTGGTNPAYIRISFPDTIATVWTMLNVEIIFRQNYQNDLGGKILINCHHNSTSPYTWVGNATVYGYLRKGDIKVYGSDGHYLYIEGIDEYSTISVEKVLVGDTARGKDLTSTTLEIVSALPSGYQTFTMYTDIDSSNIASQSVNYATTAGSATDSTKVSKSGDYMTGRLSIIENSVALNLRPNNADYYTTVSYQTSGNEALVFATKNSVTSFMFVNGEDSETNHANSRWQSLTPALQIKNNKIAINKLIANNTNLTYPLEVNGDVQATNFRGNLVGTATQATKDGDGNTISSTYAKKASVYKSAVSDSKSSWTAGEGWLADTIGPETKGVYVFIGWAEFDGSLGGRRGIKLTRHNSSSTVMASAFTSESADSGYPRTVTCVEYVTCGTDAAVSLAWRRLRLYTANNLSSGTIKGGVIMIKISDL